MNLSRKKEIKDAVAACQTRDLWHQMMNSYLPLLLSNQDLLIELMIEEAERRDRRYVTNWLAAIADELNIHFVCSPVAQPGEPKGEGEG